MDLRKKILILAGMIMVYVTTFTAETVTASSASIWFEQQEGQVYAGDEVQIKLCINADEVLGDFEGFINYDADILEYVSGPECITGGDGRLKIEDYNASASKNTRYYIMTFKAVKKGNCIFEMDAGPAAYEYESGYPMSVSGMPGSVIVEAAIDASINTDLSILKISPGILTPTFDKNIHEYSVIVDNTVNKLIISAVPEDTTSTVAIEGNTNLRVGVNEITVLVSSLSGAESTYKISVIREAEMAGVTEEPERTENDEDKTGFGVVKEKDTVLLKGKYTYKVLDNPSGLDIPSVFEKTTLMIDGAEFTAYINNNDSSKEFVLLVLENEEGSAGLYRYDRIEKTVQRYQASETDNASVSVSIQKQENYQDAIDLKEYEEQIYSLKIMISVTAGFVVLLITAVIYLLFKVKGINDELD